MIQLDPRTTALVLIDLQKRVVGLPLAPRSGPEVVRVSRALAERFRRAGAVVVLVHASLADAGDRLHQPVDRPMSLPLAGLPAGWGDLGVVPK
jgi:nicotinamidase-related amidase